MKYSRRDFLSSSALASLGISLVGCNSNEKTLRFTAPTSYQVADDVWLAGTGSIGITTNLVDNGNEVGPILARMKSGQMASQFDLQALQGGAERELATDGLIIPWDTSQIPNWAKVWESVKDLPYIRSKSNELLGIPLAINADSIIYLPEALSEIKGYETGVVNSYSVIFDEALRGKTSMEDSWLNSVIFTAIYLKNSEQFSIEDPGNLTSSELEEVMRFLIDKKKFGQFAKFWKGWEQGVQLAKSGTVYAMTGWEPIVKALQRDGYNAKYAVPIEGYEGWANTLILHKGALERGTVKEAHALVNWLLSGEYGCNLLELRGYVVPCDTTIEYAEQSAAYDAGDIRNSVAHVTQKLEGKVYWQNVRPNEHQLYAEWWERFRNS